MISNVCEICKKEYKIKPSHAIKRRTCSRICGNKLKSKEIRGESHPNFGKPHPNRANPKDVRSTYTGLVKHINKYVCGHGKGHHFGVKLLKCEECGDSFERPSCFPKTSFCSYVCSKKYISRNYSNQNSKNWKHGTTIQGYKRINVGGNRILEHRNVIMELNNISLTRNEVVHHIDGNKLNNNPTNLLLMDNGDHVRMHYKLRSNL